MLVRVSFLIQNSLQITLLVGASGVSPQLFPASYGTECAEVMNKKVEIFSGEGEKGHAAFDYHISLIFFPVDTCFSQILKPTGLFFVAANLSAEIFRCV